MQSTSTPALPTVPLTHAAQRAGLSWHQAHRLVLTGVLKAQSIGGRWHVTVESLDRYLRARSDERTEQGK